MEGPHDQIEQLLASREKLLAFVQRRISDPELAEDVLQSSLLKAFEAAPRLREQDRLVPWFYTVLRNAIVDSYRRRAAQPLSFDLRLVEDLAQREEEERVLCTCLEPLVPTLKPEYREVLQALDLNNEPADSVAARLGISATNLKVRRHRARQALRRKLEETCRACAEHHCLDCTCRQDVLSTWRSDQM